MRALLVLLVLPLLLPTGLGVPAGGRSVTKDYVAATFVPPETGCTYNNYRTGPLATPQAAYQQACFDVWPGEKWFTFRVDDAGPTKVRGWYLFTGADGRTLGRETYFCDGDAGEVPEGAVQLFVVLWGFATECPVTAVEVTTAGSLTATFW